MKMKHTKYWYTKVQYAHWTWKSDTRNLEDPARGFRVFRVFVSLFECERANANDHELEDTANQSKYAWLSTHFIKIVLFISSSLPSFIPFDPVM